MSLWHDSRVWDKPDYFLLSHFVKPHYWEMNRFISALILTVAICCPAVLGELNPGEPAPNPTLTSRDGEEATLYGLLGRVTVLHLWKCN